MNTSNNQMLSLQKSLYYNSKQSSMFLILFLLMSRKQFNKLVFNMAYFPILLKLNGKLLEEQTRILNIHISIFKFEGQSEQSKSGFLLKRTYLKPISGKEKRILP